MSDDLIKFLQSAIDLAPKIALCIIGLIFGGGLIFKTIFQQTTGYAFSIKRDNRAAFKEAQKVFRETFSEIRHHLDVGEVTLNILILSDFPNHDIAFRNFLFYLKGRRKKYICQKWEEYKEMYNELKRDFLPNKNLPPFFAATVAIAPNMESIINQQPGDAEKWEDERREKLSNVIHDLLHISSERLWFKKKQNLTNACT